MNKLHWVHGFNHKYFFLGAVSALCMSNTRSETCRSCCCSITTPWYQAGPAEFWRISIDPPSNPSHVAFIFVRFNHVVFVDEGCSTLSQQFDTSKFGTCQAKSGQNVLKIYHQLTPRLLCKDISWGNFFAADDRVQSDKCKFQTTLCASFDVGCIDSDLYGFDQNCKQIIVPVPERALKQKGIGVIATVNNPILICVDTIRCQLYTHSWWTNVSPTKQNVELAIVIICEGKPIICSVERPQRNFACSLGNRFPLPAQTHYLWSLWSSWVIAPLIRYLNAAVIRLEWLIGWWLDDWLMSQCPLQLSTHPSNYNSS